MLPLLAAAAIDNAHTGIVHPRTAPELSDVALFAVAALAIGLTRRALRRRMRKDPPQGG